jgi:hypothetical protein
VIVSEGNKKPLIRQTGNIWSLPTSQGFWTRMIFMMDKSSLSRHLHYKEATETGVIRTSVMGQERYCSSVAGRNYGLRKADTNRQMSTQSVSLMTSL